MQLALTVDAFQDDQLIFAQQLGVDQVVARLREWDAASLAALRNRVEQTGLQLAAVEGLPLRPDGPVEQIIGDIGEAGIGLAAYCWPAVAVSEPVLRGRGESLVHRRDTPEETALDDLPRLLGRLLPIAEKAGVRLACGAEALPAGGDGFEALVELCARPAHGLDLCPDVLAAAGVDPVAAIEGAADREAIAMVRLGNLRRTDAGVTDAFLDEGDLSIPRLLQTLRATGFDGPVRAAPPPGMVDDTSWGHKGRAFDMGYLKAVLQTLG